MQQRHLERLALFGTLLATFDALHGAGDQWAQDGDDAVLKGLHGRHQVYRDGTRVGTETDDRTGHPTTTASRLGWTSAARHVASYGAVQLAGTVLVTRMTGYRVGPTALLAGTVVNLGTHLVLDRRDPLLWLADRTGKRSYVDHCTAARVDADGKVTAELAGPGTALLELDQSLHRAIGVAAAALTTWLATRRR